MVEPVPEEQLKSVYDTVAPWYDWQHAFFTLRSDQKGRKLVVSKSVAMGDRVFDAGAGTGTTALLAARKAGAGGTVTLYDYSEGMLSRARAKAEKAGLAGRLDFVRGDLSRLPFPDHSFDAALSTYSLCPLFDPVQTARELYRIVRPGGKIGVAHSTQPANTVVGKLAEWAERIYWNIPELSLGCRAVEVLPALRQAGGRVIFKKRIGVPLWPFLVFVMEKPEAKPKPS